MPRLLVLDADPDVAEHLGTFLRRAGVGVEASTDLNSGLAAFVAAAQTDQPHDLVLLDSAYARAALVDAAQTIKRARPGVPVVLTHGRFRGTGSAAAPIAGVDAVIHKPFVLTEIRERVLALLGMTPPAPAQKPAGLPRTQTRGRAGVADAQTLAIASSADVCRLFFSMARQRFDGIIELVDASSRLELAWLRGVIVGARDNLREHLLGEQLWKSGRLSVEQMRAFNHRMESRHERALEALVALGYLDADEALRFLDDQVAARVRRALMWTGTATAKANAEAAEELAVTSIDLVEAVTAFAVAPQNAAAADRFISKRRNEAAEAAPDLDDLWLSFARTCPTSELRTTLTQTRMPTISQLARLSSNGEAWAGWLTGVFRSTEDPPLSRRPMPVVLKGTGSNGPVDRTGARDVAAALLRLRGGTVYDVTRLPPDAPAEVLRAALARAHAHVSRAVLGGRSLGPSLGAARELWTMLDELDEVFADPSLRAAYDARVQKTRAQSSTAWHRPEDVFLEGQQALAHGERERAFLCFKHAVEARPLDPEYGSYLAWLEILAGDQQGGEQRLLRTSRSHPQAMRPLYFLALSAAQTGELSRARTLLDECIIRSPYDVEVKSARARL